MGFGTSFETFEYLDAVDFDERCSCAFWSCPREFVGAAGAA